MIWRWLSDLLDAWREFLNPKAQRHDESCDWNCLSHHDLCDGRCKHDFHHHNSCLELGWRPR